MPFFIGLCSLVARLFRVDGKFVRGKVSHSQDPAAPAAAAPANVESAAPPQSMLKTTWDALGWKYAIAFLVMSFLLVAILVMVILAVRKDSFVPSDLIQGVEASLNDRNLPAAVELVRADESFVVRSYRPA